MIDSVQFHSYERLLLRMFDSLNLILLNEDINAILENIGIMLTIIIQ